MAEANTGTRKEQILQTAADLFKQRGYEATSMRDIAQAMGIEAASLYHHIKSKDEILESICFGMAEVLMREIHEVNDIYFNAEEKLRMAIKNHVNTITHNVSKASVFLHDWKSLNTEPMEAFKKLRHDYEQEFRVIIQNGVNEDLFKNVDEKFAVLTILSSINWITEWYAPEGEMKPDAIAERLSDFILSGLRKNLVTDPDYKP